VEDRERIANQALQMDWVSNDYNVLWNNCEHTCNELRTGPKSSPLIRLMLWFIFRLLLGLIGLAALRLNTDLVDFAGLRFDSMCAQHPRTAWLVFHILTTVPVALQAMISYILLTRSVLQQHVQALIDRHECYHLLGKEFGRALLVGGASVAVISLTPQLVSGTIECSVICAFAYYAADIVYNCCAHAVMRLVLLPVWGTVWVFGSDRHHTRRSCGKIL